MNERIQELHQQAKDFINEVSDSDGVYQGKEYMQAVREKFAELIVRECIAQARSEEDRFYGLGEDDLALTMEHFQEVLKHHFGVE
jgi:hypothetical protein